MRLNIYNYKLYIITLHEILLKASWIKLDYISCRRSIDRSNTRKLRDLFIVNDVDMLKLFPSRLGLTS
uniref:Uncharacterized protein n=1 Tax=Ignisphaera aggregans TaxID=334771 RepID=A0A7C4H2N9_9CREN